MILPLPLPERARCSGLESVILPQAARSSAMSPEEPTRASPIVTSGTSTIRMRAMWQGVLTIEGRLSQEVLGPPPSPEMLEKLAREVENVRDRDHVTDGD